MRVNLRKTPPQNRKQSLPPPPKAASVRDAIPDRRALLRGFQAVRFRSRHRAWRAPPSREEDGNYAQQSGDNGGEAGQKDVVDAVDLLGLHLKRVLQPVHPALHPVHSLLQMIQPGLYQVQPGVHPAYQALQTAEVAAGCRAVVVVRLRDADVVVNDLRAGGGREQRNAQGEKRKADACGNETGDGNAGKHCRKLYHFPP